MKGALGWIVGVIVSLAILFTTLFANREIVAFIGGVVVGGVFGGLIAVIAMAISFSRFRYDMMADSSVGGPNVIVLDSSQLSGRPPSNEPPLIPPVSPEDSGRRFVVIGGDGS